MVHFQRAPVAVGAVVATLGFVCPAFLAQSHLLAIARPPRLHAAALYIAWSPRVGCNDPHVGEKGQSHQAVVQALPSMRVREHASADEFWQASPHRGAPVQRRLWVGCSSSLCPLFPRGRDGLRPARWPLARCRLLSRAGPHFPPQSLHLAQARSRQPARAPPASGCAASPSSQAGFEVQAREA